MKGFLAFCLPLLVAAAPAKRQAIEYDTVTSIIYETEIVATTTVWVDGPIPTVASVTSSQSSVSVAAVSSTLATHTSSYVPPVSTVNAYTAPTTKAPAPTTVAPAYTPPPATSSVYVAPVASPAPAQSPSSNGASQLGGGPFSGDMTAYVDTGAPLACGGTFGSDANLVAISHTTFDQYTPSSGNPNDNPLCGKSITLTYNGQSFPATIQDRCTGCNPGDLDLPEGFWTQVTGGQPYGRLQVSWTT